MTRPVALSVDEVVVRGLPPREARAAAAALEERLRLLAAGGQPEPPRSPGAAAADAVWAAVRREVPR